MNTPFEWAAFFKAEKVNKRPGLTKRPPSNQERGAHLEICNLCKDIHSESL